MADAYSLQGAGSIPKRSKSKLCSLILDLWSSSDEDETSKRDQSRELAPNTPSPKRLAKPLLLSPQQSRESSSLDLGESILQGLKRQRGRFGKELAKHPSNTTCSKSLEPVVQHGSAATETTRNEKGDIMNSVSSIQSATGNQSKRTGKTPPFLRHSVNGYLKDAKPARSRHQRSFERIPGKVSSHSSVGRDAFDNVLKEHDSNPKDNHQYLAVSNDKMENLGGARSHTHGQSSSSWKQKADRNIISVRDYIYGHKNNRKIHSRTQPFEMHSSDSSSQEESDAESRATTGNRDYSYSRANFGWQPRSRQGDENSSSTNSSSSDSESLLSPSKPKPVHSRSERLQTLPQRNQSNQLGSSVRRQESGSHKHAPQSKEDKATFKDGQSLRLPKRSKHRLNKDGDRVQRYKKATMSPVFHAEISDSSSSSSDDESSQRRVLKMFKGDQEKRYYQSSRPLKASHQEMMDLFGRTSSDDGGNETEEDVPDIRGGEEVHVEIEKRGMDATKDVGKVSSAQKSLTKNLSFIPIDADSDIHVCPEETTSPKKRGVFHTRHTCTTAGTQASSSSRRDDSVILLDIIQSNEGNALSGKSCHKMSVNSSQTPGTASSEGSEKYSPVFARHVPTQKKLPKKLEDILSNSESVSTGFVSEGKKSKNSHLDPSNVSTESHLVLGSYINDSFFRPRFTGRSNSQQQTNTSVFQDSSHNRPRSPVFSHVSEMCSRRVSKKNPKHFDSPSDSESGSKSSTKTTSSSQIFPSSLRRDLQSPTFGVDLRDGLQDKSHNSSRSSTFGACTSYFHPGKARETNAKPIVSPSAGPTIESPEVRTSNSQSQTTATTLQDNPHVPRTSCEQDRHWLEQERSPASSDDSRKSPVFVSWGIVEPQRKLKSSQSPEAGSTDDLSFEEDHLQWAKRRRVSNKTSTSSSIGKFHRTSKPDVRQVKSHKSELGGLHVDGHSGRSKFADQSRRYDTHQGEKQKRGQDSRKQERVDSSSSVPAPVGRAQIQKDFQPKIQAVQSQGSRQGSNNGSSSSKEVWNSSKSLKRELDEVRHRGSRHQMQNYNSGSSAAGISTRDSQPDVQIVNSYSSNRSGNRSQLKIRRTKNQEGPSGQPSAEEFDSQSRRRKTEKSGSQAADESTNSSQPDVQIVGSQDSSIRRKRKREKRASGRPVSPDIMRLVKQLDDDEAMARQLQEHFDAEAARLTEQYNEINADANQPTIFHDVDNPLRVPPLPQPPQVFPSVGSFTPLPPLGVGHEMTGRDDLADMNPVNAAMMAEMGRFLVDNMELQGGQHLNVRRGQGGRGRGRSRNRGRRYGYMHSPMSNGSDYETLWNLAERVGEAVSKGLPESSINLLPTFPYASGKEATEKECSICMGEYEAGENMRRLPCFHFYHATCIDKWLKENRICPVCREEVNFDPVNFI